MQLAFDFTPGLTAQFPKLRDVLCASVYNSRGGLKAVASDLDVSPSELSRMLNRDQDDPRKLDVDVAVAIVDSTGDMRAVYWMIERFLRDPAQVRAQAAAEIARLLPTLNELVRQSGATKAKR